ncbi:NERD domain-containing protein [Flavobacterium zhairuonense]|uniref:nuclease-related domain-containing protein n=1 Tax=Flavobacterium zhairuonense TaxID=2493631 RepID=UPI00105238CA|nr:nuclease-related domain-containing protein [Flavobacterium zhairuonense]KAF2508643.1 NERD domain-containing protein [Flavobacterium zhairuonense]
MCRVYNTIGCLNTLQIDLVRYNIDHFHSLNELINFRKNHKINEEQIISNHTLFIEEEKSALEKDLSELNTFIPQKKMLLELQLRQQLDNFNDEIENLPETHSRIIPTIKDYWLNLVICTKFWSAQLKYHYEIFLFNYEVKKQLLRKNKRFEYIATNFQNVVNESSFYDLQAFEKKKEIIETLSNTIYGAVGEQKVESMLKKLTDDYILINDFCCTFNPSIYNKNNHDHIHSIQIDHLLISPAGIFLIETKNWSEDSISNLDLRSPVEQVLRTNYALFRLFNNQISKLNHDFSRQYWGNRKVPIKNIIVFTNKKPIEEFQFVKILTVDELLPYIKYFDASFLIEETEIIADFLLKFSEQKQVHSKLTN